MVKNSHGEELFSFTPPDRYAGMRNVYFLPTINCLTTWLEKSKLININIISVTHTTEDEQRNTQWCPEPQSSLKHFLDPKDKTKTIEGLPAPCRVLIKAQKK